MSFEEWWTTDRNGNHVECRANEYVELHAKKPVCECGRVLRKVGVGLWECSSCKLKYTYDDLFRNYGPEAYSYDCNAGTLQDDYGERKYEKLPMSCGPEEIFNRYTM